MKRFFLPILIVFLIKTPYVFGNTDKNISIGSSYDTVKEPLIEKGLWDTHVLRKNAFSLNRSNYFDPASVSAPQKYSQKTKIDSKATAKKLKDTKETLPSKNNGLLDSTDKNSVEKNQQETKQETLITSKKEEQQMEKTPSILTPIPSIKPKLN